MAVLFITHDMGVVAEIADRVCVMLKGEIVETGPVHDIFNNPKHRYTRALISAVPRLGSMADKQGPEKFPLLVYEEEQALTGRRNEHDPTSGTGQKPLIEVRELVTRFDLKGGLLGRTTGRVHAVENVSFDIFPGETLALVGESGCGKSTVARSIMQLDRPQSGSIRYQEPSWSAHQTEICDDFAVKHRWFFRTLSPHSIRA